MSRKTNEDKALKPKQKGEERWVTDIFGTPFPYVPPPIGQRERGGPGSGHHGHKGRPGEIGGSRPRDGEDAEVRIGEPQHEFDLSRFWRDQETVTLFHGIDAAKLEKYREKGLRVSIGGYTEGKRFFATSPITAWRYSAMGGEVLAKGHARLSWERRAILVLQMPSDSLIATTHFLKTREHFEKAQQALKDDPGLERDLLAGGEFFTTQDVPFEFVVDVFRYPESEKGGALRAILKAVLVFKAMERSGFSPKEQGRSYPAPHYGRPGQVGGSRPREEGALGGVPGSDVILEDIHQFIEGQRETDWPNLSGPRRMEAVKQHLVGKYGIEDKYREVKGDLRDWFGEVHTEGGERIAGEMHDRKPREALRLMQEVTQYELRRISGGDDHVRLYRGGELGNGIVSFTRDIDVALKFAERYVDDLGEGDDPEAYVWHCNVPIKDVWFDFVYANIGGAWDEKEVIANADNAEVVTTGIGSDWERSYPAPHCGAPGEVGGSRPREECVPNTGLKVPKFYSLQQAEQWARENLTSYADYGDFVNVEFAQSVNETVADVLEHCEWTGISITGRQGLAGITISKGPNSQAFSQGAGKIDIGNLAWAYKTFPARAHLLSAYSFDNGIEGVVRHELGHIFHRQHRTDFDNLLKGSDWQKKFGVTRRARDNRGECVAENFALYSGGKLEGLHPDMVALLRRLTTWPW